MTIRSSFLAGSVALATAFGAVVPPAQAAPIQPVPLAAAPFGEVVPVQARRRRALLRQRARRNRAFRQGVQRGRRIERRRDRRRDRGRVAAGIVGGLIVGGLIANAARRGPVYAAPAPVYRAPRYSYGPRHHDWCYARYRSYRASDGTYQPYHGPRRRCNSPYDGI